MFRGEVEDEARTVLCPCLGLGSRLVGGDIGITIDVE